MPGRVKVAQCKVDMRMPIEGGFAIRRGPVPQICAEGACWPINLALWHTHHQSSKSPGIGPCVYGSGGERERETERDYTYPALRLIQVLPGHPLADSKDETVSSLQRRTSL